MYNPFDNFKKTALRVEALPTYSIDGEKDNFDRFVNGQPLNEDNNRDWLNSVNKWTKDGKFIKRIRVLDDKLTMYSKYELLCYYQNYLAGEQIDIIDTNTYLSLVDKHYQCDFWIFDSKEVAILNYDKSGKFLKLDIINDIGEVEKFINIFNLLDNNIVCDYTKIVSQINCSESIIDWEILRND